jgi:GT2 family glycosyltransferase
VSEDDRPLIDVGVLTWNTGELTAQALRHLLDTDQGCRLRLLVRDNGSQDGTVETLRARVPEAEIDAGAENLGFAAGVNKIFARSTAPWFFLLNSDAWPQPGAIRRLVDAAVTHPRAGAIVPRLENPDGTLQHSTHPFPSPGISLMSALGPRVVGPVRSDQHLLNGGWKGDRARDVDWAIAAAWLIRRSALHDIGGLDERFFMYAEDLEWCWRARKGGWTIWFEPSAVVRHVSNVSGEMAWGSERTRMHARNAYRFYSREHPMSSTLAWWGLNAAGAAKRCVGAMIRRDRAQARTWRMHLVAQLRAPRAISGEKSWSR